MSTQKPPNYFGAVGERWLGSDGCGYFRPGRILPPTERKATQQAKRRWCLETLSERRVPQSVRNAILKELGVPPRQYNASNQALKAWIAGQLVKARKAEMKAKGERPHGGRHEAAVEEVAAIAGVSPSALKQRHRRAKKSRLHD